MPRITARITVLVVLFVLLTQFNACSQKAVTHDFVIADSCLNVDTLQIVGQELKFNASRDIIDDLWTARAGNRTMLLQYIQWHDNKPHLSPGYYKILGVFIHKESLGGEIIFYYVTLKFNWGLRNDIPMVLQKDYPNEHFNW
ncbi:hypothetical protein KJ840_05600 [Patescibacteria group bacterium]|nr:hypothetical protein [Patescibacteria group bacterium]